MTEMPSADLLRTLLQSKLVDAISDLNVALKGRRLKKLSPVLQRLGRNSQLPHWFSQLSAKGTLPNLDGKTIGSVVEMLLVAVLQTRTFSGVANLPDLRINPARGVDLPDLGLGVKSPSKNYCTSEPFFSAYERLLGNEHDALIILTDYQEAKKSPPLKLQIINYEYLRGSEIADEGLCTIARTHRSFLLAQNESWAKKLFRFLSFVNQSDWLACQLIRIAAVIQDEDKIKAEVSAAIDKLESTNRIRGRQDKPLIEDSQLSVITGILEVKPILLGVIDAIDNWVVDTQKDAGRYPNDNEWERLREAALDGKITVSPALQWRYNFQKVFSD